MQPKQLAVLIVAVVIFLIALLTPPWLYEDVRNQEQRSAGYHLFGRKAEIKSDAEMNEIFLLSKTEMLHSYIVRKDSKRLYCELTAILFLTIGIALFVDERKNPLVILLSIAVISIDLVFVSLVMILSWTIRYA